MIDMDDEAVVGDDLEGIYPATTASSSIHEGPCFFFFYQSRKSVPRMGGKFFERFTATYGSYES